MAGQKRALGGRRRELLRWPSDFLEVEMGKCERSVRLVRPFPSLLLGLASHCTSSSLFKKLAVCPTQLRFASAISKHSSSPTGTNFGTVYEAAFLLGSGSVAWSIEHPYLETSTVANHAVDLLCRVFSIFTDFFRNQLSEDFDFIAELKGAVARVLALNRGDHPGLAEVLKCHLAGGITQETEFYADRCVSWCPVLIVPDASFVRRATQAALGGAKLPSKMDQAAGCTCNLDGRAIFELSDFEVKVEIAASLVGFTANAPALAQLAAEPKYRQRGANTEQRNGPVDLGHPSKFVSLGHTNNKHFHHWAEAKERVNSAALGSFLGRRPRMIVFWVAPGASTEIGWLSTSTCSPKATLTITCLIG